MDRHTCVIRQKQILALSWDLPAALCLNRRVAPLDPPKYNCWDRGEREGEGSEWLLLPTAQLPPLFLQIRTRQGSLQVPSLWSHL